MSTLTAREVKNQVISRLPERKRQDAIVGETRNGGYIILTDVSVVEVYESAGCVWAQEREFGGTFWQDYTIIDDTEG